MFSFFEDIFTQKLKRKRKKNNLNIVPNGNLAKKTRLKASRDKVVEIQCFFFDALSRILFVEFLL